MYLNLVIVAALAFVPLGIVALSDLKGRRKK